MKKTLSVFLTFCLVFTTLMTGVVTAFAEGNVIEGTNITWNYNETTGELHFEGEGAIPDFNHPIVDGDKVIEYPWKDIPYTSIVFSEGITGIGNYTFAYSKSLKSVAVPDTVTVLGKGIFLNCEKLESVVLPAEPTEIGESVFSNCESLKNVTFGAKTEKIGKEAFYSCASLETVAFPSTLKEIGEAAFHSTGLKAIVLPEGFTTVGERAFYACENAESISLPSTLTTIGSYAFEGCRSITEITFPASVTALPESVCASCVSLEKVTLPETLTAIGTNAFYGCPALKGITIPAATTVIGEKALGFGRWGVKVIGFTITGCVNSEPVIKYAKEYSFKYNPIGYITSGTCGEKATWEYNEEEKMLYIKGEGATTNYKADSFVAYNLIPYEKILIVPQITEIGSYAFYNAAAMDFVISSNVTKIGEKAIGYYDNKGTPTLREGTAITGITGSEANRYAFENNIAFNSLGYITSGTCGENATWEYKEDEKTLYINGSGAMADYKADSFVPYHSIPYEKVVIAPEITKIGSYAFYNAAAMDFRLTEAVAEIGEKAIGYYDNDGTPALREGTNITGYDGLAPMVYASENNIKFNSLGSFIITEGKLGDSITWVYDIKTKALTVSGTGATYNYSSDKLPEFASYDIESITVSDGITALGDYVFCTKVAYTSITLGKDIEKIGAYALGYIKTEASEEAVVNKSAVVRGYISTPADDYALRKGLKFEALDGDKLPLFSLVVSSVIDHAKKLVIIYKNSPDAKTIVEAFPAEDFAEVTFPEVFGTGKEMTLVNENGTYTYKIVVKGDNDGNGTINSSDALAVLQHSVESKVMKDDCSLAASDVNNDGSINSSDALAILQISVGSRADDVGYDSGIIR